MKLFSLLLAVPFVASCIVVIGDGDWDSDAKERVHGSGRIVAEQRSSEPFEHVHLDTAADVRVTIGEETSILVRADDNALPYLLTDVRNGKLSIDRSSDVRLRNVNVEIEIVTPSLASFVIDGAGDVWIDGLAEDDFQAEIDGAGNLHASGAVESLAAEIDGAGSLSLAALEARNASVEIDGSGNIQVHATEALRYTIDGSGNIVYAGSPALRGSIHGSGNVRPLER